MRQCPKVSGGVLVLGVNLGGQMLPQPCRRFLRVAAGEHALVTLRALQVSDLNPIQLRELDFPVGRAEVPAVGEYLGDGKLTRPLAEEYLPPGLVGGVPRVAVVVTGVRLSPAGAVEELAVLHQPLKAFQLPVPVVAERGGESHNPLVVRAAVVSVSALCREPFGRVRLWVKGQRFSGHISLCLLYFSDVDDDALRGVALATV